MCYVMNTPVWKTLYYVMFFIDWPLVLQTMLRLPSQLIKINKSLDNRLQRFGVDALMVIGIRYHVEVGNCFFYCVVGTVRW